MATGRAPISGGFAIACGLLFATAVVLALASELLASELSWFTVVSAFGTFVIAVLSWRRFQRSDQQYRERMERLDQRLGRGS
ncbi:hypothetical protein GCM10011374_02970 [Kocuria dechangensis]|uniref:Uncharacterized protein n=1 Tax=Kocuria dechangensis TaxID=1176249 RepID=A0A917GFL8_9MICC|nr:hypothetical protein [Kocuria dechangensis]GGG44020.1 hypothetical protein GCM10011374_02970 [Kocuria dechangensis]